MVYGPLYLVLSGWPNATTLTTLLSLFQDAFEKIIAKRTTLFDSNCNVIYTKQRQTYNFKHRIIMSPLIEI